MEQEEGEGDDGRGGSIEGFFFFLLFLIMIVDLVPEIVGFDDLGGGSAGDRELPAGFFRAVSSSIA